MPRGFRSRTVRTILGANARCLHSYSDGVRKTNDYLRLWFGIRVKGPQYTLLLNLPGQLVGAPANLPTTKRAAAPDRREDAGSVNTLSRQAISTQVDQGLGIDRVISGAAQAFPTLTICLFAQMNHLTFRAGPGWFG